MGTVRAGVGVVRRNFLAVFVLVSFCVCATIVSAQEITGSIVGTVSDSKGGVVPNARVTITNTDQQVVVRTLTTDDHGQYAGPLLSVGRYSVTVEIAGFRKVTQSASPQ